MSPISSSLLLGAGAAAAGGLQISRSIRLNSADSAYFSRTPAVAGNRRTWTWAAWMKRSGLSNGVLFATYYAQNTSEALAIRFVSDKIDFCNWLNTYVVTDAVYRDPGAWYHIVFAFDTTQAIAADRIKIYVNGIQQTLSSGFYGYPSQNVELGINQAALHSIGSWEPSVTTGAPYFNGYLTNIHFIDGQALTPSSFTETDATTGQLIPKTYTGTYGTNGYNLLFADNSSSTASTLGKDYSGLGNNWTPNNLSVTAGAGNDSLVDVPTNGTQTDTGAGGEVRGNYCTLNPLKKGPHITSVTNGNLEFESTGASQYGQIWGTIGVSSGKWYWEGVMTAGGGTGFGWGLASANSLTSEPGGDANTWVFLTSGYKYNSGSIAAFGSSCSIGDVVGIAFDADTGALSFYKNGVSMGTAYTLTTGLTYAPLTGDPNSSTNCAVTVNFGQRPFAYTAPSGFKALCTTNLPAPLVTKSNTVMDVVLYTGDGGTQTVSGLAFGPDFVWTKVRNIGYGHRVWDTVRGATKRLETHDTTAEVTETTALTAFNSDGFTVGSEANVNQSGRPYVAWAWDAGTSTTTINANAYSAGVPSITSQVRANATAGFSVVTYTGTGTAGATVGHGLGVAPAMIITKCRNNASDWDVYHSGLATPASNRLVLQSTAAVVTSTSQWNYTNPSSTVVTLGTSYSGNFSGYTHVMYAFAPVVGYSNGFSYTGNGSTDGVFVYLGMRPKLLLIKRTNTTGNWYLWDTVRNTYNVVGEELYPNLSSAAATATDLDILSNGFKMRSTAADFNASGGTYVGFAWAESPFNYSRAR